MNTLLILLSIIGFCYGGSLELPNHLRAPLKLMRKACMAETGVDEKYILQSVNGNLPDVPELKCYVLCLLEHSGMIEDDGTIHFTQVLHLLTPSYREAVDYVTKECETIHGPTRCETAWLTIKCYFEKLPEGSELP